MRQAVRTPHFWLLFAVYMFNRPGQLPGRIAPVGLRRRTSDSTSSTPPGCSGAGAFLVAARV